MNAGDHLTGARERVPAEIVSRWSALFGAGRTADCEALALQLTRDLPAAAKAWQLLAMSCYARGDLAAAADYLRKAASFDGEDHSIWDNLGIVLQKSGDYAAAREAYRTALARRPSAAGVWSNAAGNELDAGNADEALRLANRAVSLSPTLAGAWLQLGNVLGRLQRSAEAEAALREALRIRPRYPEAWLSLSAELAAQNRLAEACAAANAALAIDPSFAQAHVNLGSLHDRLGELDRAQQHYRRARELDPALLGSWSSELYCLSHDESRSPQEVFLAHEAFGEYVDRRFGVHVPPHANDRDPERRLRVGVLSGDLRDHPVARFLEPVWRELDRSRLLLLAYDTRPGTDALAMRLRALADEWVDVSTLSDEALAARIRADAIDVLIDHSGHTAGNRLGVFARRPAPLQLMWFGYPGTSGLRSMDYRLVDAAIAPPGKLDHLFTETLAYLPAMLVFAKPERLPELTPAPSERNGYITYGSFNRMNKIGDAVVARWAEILAAVANARLVVGAVPDDAVAVATRARLAAAGIAPERVDILPRLDMADYLAAHARVDLLLDTFPWTSSTTANFGLWMGVPTVTLAGASLVSRLGLSTMAAAGLDGFVAGSEAEYVAIAVRSAAYPEELQRIRRSLRTRLEDNCARVPGQVAQVLELRLRQMWKRWCAGLPPCVLQD